MKSNPTRTARVMRPALTPVKVPVKVGIILPSFAQRSTDAIDVARRAERVGIDGVFCYDHLWPMGQPERPAIAPFPLLAAIAAQTERIAVGTLVARIGLVPDNLLVAEVDTLEAIAPGRAIIGIGTGDGKSADENAAFGVPFDAAEERRNRLRAVARELRDRGVPVWIGGGASATLAIAEQEGVAVNMWGAGPDEVRLQALVTEVTWAGPSPKEGTLGTTEGDERTIGAAALESRVHELAAVGATWIVFGWPVDIEALRGAAGAR